MCPLGHRQAGRVGGLHMQLVADAGTVFVIFVHCAEFLQADANNKQVPFKAFKRHQRNGVVFCFFGSRVFVTCMDDECRMTLARRSKAFFSLAKELEDIHLGAYDECMTIRHVFVPEPLPSLAYPDQQ